jgi:chemotaxis protein methyltransferase CheR
MIRDKKDVMSEDEFGLLRDLIVNEFGILMKGDKRLTLHTKVSHRLSILGLGTYREYYDYLMAEDSKEELYSFVSHITNNETYFFRERNQLSVFSELLPELKRERQKSHENTLRIASLASSSGEEAYSVNILVQESGLFAWDWDVRIIGVDIDRNAIRKAREACYTTNSFRVMNGNAGYIERYFGCENGQYLLKRPLTKNVEFKVGNILDSSLFEDMGKLDVIFCRNVLIYMSDEAILKMARNFHYALSDTGYLFIGSSESLIQKTNHFVPEFKNGIIIYRKNLKKERDCSAKD